MFSLPPLHFIFKTHVSLISLFADHLSSSGLTDHGQVGSSDDPDQYEGGEEQLFVHHHDFFGLSSITELSKIRREKESESVNSKRI